MTTVARSLGQDPRVVAVRMLTAALVGLLAVTLAPRPAAAEPREEPGVLVVQTVPPVPGARVSADGNIARADSSGVARLPVAKFTGLEQRFNAPQTKVAKDRRVTFDRVRGQLHNGFTGRPVEVGLRTERLIRWSFTDRTGQPVLPDRLTRLILRSSTGELLTLTGAEIGAPRWLAASRTQQTSYGLMSKDIYWSVQSVLLDGAELVNRSQQRFVPDQETRWTISLLFFQAQVRAADLLFGTPTGQGIEVTAPDGQVSRHPFDEDGVVTLPAVPRGEYTMTVYGSGISFSRPVSVSKDQQVELLVISRLDVALVLLTLLLIAVSLVLVGRRRRITQWSSGRRQGGSSGRRRGESSGRRRGESSGRWWRAPGQRWRALRDGSGGGASTGTADGDPGAAAGAGDASGLPAVTRTGIALALALIAGLALAVGGQSAPASAVGQPAAAPASSPVASASADGHESPIPVVAYYYIWFNPTSWNRAKTDFPLLGRYSSDDHVVMAEHIRMASAAGIDGFLVSWKRSPQLNDRLATLTQEAAAASFRLGLVYQGLDFERRPLPITQVQEDLEWFAEEYGRNSTFRMLGDRPVVVWTGTEKFSTADIARVTAAVGDRLLVLASAKNVPDYERVAKLVAGNAYYWSSVKPDMPGYPEKLAAMSRAVHDAGGLWIAPFAPGFDARLVGGTSVVPRNGGQTLRRELAVAQASNPDALGLISWNEFSENTHVEPSEEHGTTDLHALALALGATPPPAPQDSSDDNQRAAGVTGWGAIVLLGLAIGVLNLIVLWRGRGRTPAPAGPLDVDRSGDE